MARVCCTHACSHPLRGTHTEQPHCNVWGRSWQWHEARRPALQGASARIIALCWHNMIMLVGYMPHGHLGFRFTSIRSGFHPFVSHPLDTSTGVCLPVRSTTCILSHVVCHETSACAPSSADTCEKRLSPRVQALGDGKMDTRDSLLLMTLDAHSVIRPYRIRGLEAMES